MVVRHLHLNLRDGRLGTKMGGALVPCNFSHHRSFFDPCSQRTGGLLHVAVHHLQLNFRDGHLGTKGGVLVP